MTCAVPLTIKGFVDLVGILQTTSLNGKYLFEKRLKNFDIVDVETEVRHEEPVHDQVGLYIGS